MYKILIVEDDATIAVALERYLGGWGMQVRCARAFDAVLSEFVEFCPHLVLMDISLPFFNGFHWCGEIRKLSKAPVIFISSASDNMNIVMAVNMGGDDFIAKPFDLDVLSAKVRALLRRTYDFSAGADFLEHRGVILNLSEVSVRYNDEVRELTKNEFRILQVLLENKGALVGRDALMQRLWQTDCFVDENTLSVNIARLRKKLGGMGIENLIATKKGMGYMIE